MDSYSDRWMKRFQSDGPPCEYCGFPVEAPSIIGNVNIGLGITLTNRVLHPECKGHFRAEKQTMLIAYVSLFNGMLALVLSIIAVLR